MLGFGHDYSEDHDSSLLYGSPMLSSTPNDPSGKKVICAESKKLPKASKQSYYFKPLTEVRIINSAFVNNGLTRKRGFLLPNGNVCKVLKIEGDATSLRNTCAFDSVIQIVQFGAIDYLQYNAALQASNNKTLQFVLKFLKKTGPLETFSKIVR